MLLFTSSLTNRNQIKKSMSDRTSQSCELTHSPKTTCSSNSDISNDNSTKKSPLSFHLFDSILSRTTNKSMSININPSKKSSSTTTTPPTSSSYPQTSCQLPEQARCLYHYNAIKHDEICVHRGEYVQIINVDEDNRWYVRRQTSPTTKGWLPGFVLGIKYPNSTHNNNNSSNNLTTTTTTNSSLSSNNLDHL